MQNAKGRLAEAYTGSSTKRTDLGYSYSARGEVTDVWQAAQNSPGYYHVSAGYWPTGPAGLIQTLNLNMSGVPTWTYTPDGEGRSASVSASSGQNPVTSASYNLFSLPTAVTLGSGDSDAFTYDGNTGRMTGYSASLGVTPSVSLAVTGPQSGATYSDTDTFTVTVYGAANTPVYINQNNGGNVQMGTTNNTGNGMGTYTVSSQWASKYDGTYNQVWSVGSTAATPVLNFTLVSGTPTPTSVATTSTLGPSPSGTLTWNANGTLAQLAGVDGFNAGNTQTCNYTHDDLARLGQIDCGVNNGSTKFGQGYSYDGGNGPFGNISWAALNNHSGSTFSMGYNPSTNHFTGTAQYDANGNLLSDGSHSYSWDAEGNLRNIDGGGYIRYDAFDRRLEQPNGSGYLDVIYGPDGSKLALVNVQSGVATLAKAFVPLPGGATAVYNSSGLAWYRHPDWLGSSRIASTPSTRTMYYDGAYSPMGETIAEAGTTDRNFTGQNQDLAPDLYDFTYRDYHAANGRWISPDPAGMGAVDPANPQTWNRYAYVANSPLANVDADGQDAEGAVIFLDGPFAPVIDIFATVFDMFELMGGGGHPPPAPPGPPQPAAPPALSGTGPLSAGGGGSEGEPWSEQVPIGVGGLPLNTGTVFGSGNTGPYVFSAMNGNTAMSFGPCMKKRAQFFSLIGMVDLAAALAGKDLNWRNKPVLDFLLGNATLGLATGVLGDNSPGGTLGSAYNRFDPLGRGMGKVGTQGTRKATYPIMNIAGKPGLRTAEVLERGALLKSGLAIGRVLGSILKLDPGFIAGEALTCVLQPE